MKKINETRDELLQSAIKDSVCKKFGHSGILVNKDGKVVIVCTKCFVTASIK